MNDVLNKLERKFGKYAIKNISLYLVLLYAAAYLVIAVDATLLNYISLNPYALMRGQIWRLVTWIMIPPSLGLSVLTLLLLYIFYRFGTTLEQKIGVFRYNIYLLSGMIFTVIGALAVMAYLFAAIPDLAMLDHNQRMDLFSNVAMSFSTYYVYMSIFMAVAVVIPDMTIYFMFVIPVKMKYIGIIYGFYMVYEFVATNTYNRIVIFASMLNFLVFFLSTRKKARTPKQVIRSVAYHQEIKKVKLKTMHKCAICGVTNTEAPEREFRYCSKCNGNYEYCDQHLYTHPHVSKEEHG